MGEKRSQSQLTSYTRPGRSLKSRSPRKQKLEAIQQEMAQGRVESAPSVSNVDKEKFMA